MRARRTANRSAFTIHASLCSVFSFFPLAAASNYTNIPTNRHTKNKKAIFLPTIFIFFFFLRFAEKPFLFFCRYNTLLTFDLKSRAFPTIWTNEVFRSQDLKPQRVIFYFPGDIVSTNLKYKAPQYTSWQRKTEKDKGHQKWLILVPDTWKHYFPRRRLGGKSTTTLLS